MRRKLLILSAVSMLSVGMAQAQSSKARVTVKMNTGATQESVYAFDTKNSDDFFRMDFCLEEDILFEDGKTKSEGQIYFSKQIDGTANPLMFIDRSKCHVTLEYANNSEDIHGPSVAVSNLSQGWGTICSPFVMEVPDESTGLNVYNPTYNAEKSTLVLGDKLEAGTKIPRQTPLLVRSSKIPASGTQDFLFNAPLSDNGATLAAQSLKWSLYGYNKGNATNVFTLGKSTNTENDVVGFYKYTGSTVPNFKAYLVVSSTGSSKAVTLSMGEEETTSIDGITDVVNVSNTAYNLSGQRVNNNAKGFIIINGKKIFNK